MKAIITGGIGLIGTEFLREFTERGWDVSVIDLKTGGDITTMKFDCLENKQPIDLIIHCAAFCTIKDCIEYPESTHYHNAFGTFQVLETARITGCKKVIFMSSSRVLYPEKNIYTATKIYGEELCKAYSSCYGIDYIIIRPSTVFGELDSTNRIIPRFIKNAKSNKPLIIYGDKNKTLGLTYIHDFITEVLKAYDSNQKNVSINIVDEEVSVAEIAEFIIKETSSSSKIKFENPELEQPQKVTHKGIICTPKIGWKEGLKRTIMWCK